MSLTGFHNSKFGESRSYQFVNDHTGEHHADDDLSLKFAEPGGFACQNG